MTPDERAALRVTDPIPRAWFWPASQLTYRWLPIQHGGDEFARRTIGLRVPGGIWWIALWRYRGWSGPCARCQQWEPDGTDGIYAWEPPHCQTCTLELQDYAEGCLCSLFLEDDSDLEEWPHPECAVHEHLVRS